jgi:glycosyltransferase involved in cell wall biosynthesis
VHVYYLPLESYPERYTDWLGSWTVERFYARQVPHTVVYGTSQGSEIKVGRVLDAFGRSVWSLTQMASLMAQLELHDWDTEPDVVVYMDDLFTPGFEALPYTFAQMPEGKRPMIFARNHAQSVDPDDFTFPMRHWMRKFEEMFYACATGIFVSSEAHIELMEIANLPVENVFQVGHPFSIPAVLQLLPEPLKPVVERKRRVTYASRLDPEKQPHFFLDVVERVHALDPTIVFAICTGSKELKADAEALSRIAEWESRGVIEVHKGCTKSTYYGVLADSRVHLNTARQDFVSYTAIEASTFGVPTLAPAFRSFPECLENRSAQLYAPWCADEAAKKVIALVDGTTDLTAADIKRLSTVHHDSLDLIIDLFDAGAQLQHARRAARATAH